jgi:poly(3-hydroxybutyrate) depolymerase
VESASVTAPAIKRKGKRAIGGVPVDSVVAMDVTRLEYTECAVDAAAVLYPTKGGGHTWPGGQPLPQWFAGRTSNSIDASSLMWAFVRAHRLRGGQTGAQHK